jgi:hypothetical protein
VADVKAYTSPPQIIERVDGIFAQRYSIQSVRNDKSLPWQTVKLNYNGMLIDSMKFKSLELPHGKSVPKRFLDVYTGLIVSNWEAE